MSGDNDTIRNRRKRKTLFVEDSSDSDSSIETTRRKRRKHRICVRDSDTESDSSIEIVHKRRVGKITDDTDQSSSGSEIVRSKRQVATLASDSDASTSDSEYDSDWVAGPAKKQAETKPDLKNDSTSDSGDDQLEKCPICLLPFKNQEVGSPESCDHSFCIDCILEWSKNVNTCPVDRQVYNLILVRSNYNGKITKQIPVENAQPQLALNETVEDPTFCEICGSCDREDRLLLCDGCDLGFHLECLDPPLEEVPVGLWFCFDCGPGDEESSVELFEVHLLLEDAETLGWFNGPRSRNTTTRLVPRTRQSERVRARVITRRNQTQGTENATDRQENNRRERSNSRAGPSGRPTDGSASVANRSNRNRRKRRSRKSRVRVTYEIDEVTGERIAIEAKIKHRRKRRSRKQRERARIVAKAMRTVKGRLALQLGMRPTRHNNAPPIVEGRASEHANNIGYQRSQAGIPALHLFGRRDDLDYYGDTDSDEDISSGNLLIRRRPQASDVTLFRRAARRKALMLPPTHQSRDSQQQQQQQSTNVLDSILDIQSKFHSRNSVISLNQDGSLKIDSKNASFNDKNNNNKEKDKNSVNNRRERMNLNDYANAYFRQTPLYGNGSPSSQSVYNNNADFTRRTNTENRNAVSTSSEQILHGSTSNERDEDRQSNSLQRVCSSYDYDPEKKEKEKEKSRSNTPATPNSDSELDIYSDIETVSTSRAEDFDAKAPSPAMALTPNTPTDEDANNSDVDLIIDTEKGDDSKELVTSTVDLPDPIPEPHPNVATSSQPILETVQCAPLEIQNQTVQSTNSKIGNEKEEKEEDDDDDSEDGCPNFSIYSSESMNIAKTTDLQLLTENKTPSEPPKVLNDADASAIYTPETNTRSIADISLPPSDDSQIVGRSDTTEGGDAAPAVVRNNFSYSKPGSMHCGLYSDSDDETLIKITKVPFGNEEKAEEPEVEALCQANESDKDTSGTSESPAKTKEPFALVDISNMTEDISEEERSYTPCLDERAQKQGLEGLDTEMISDEDRNDFDESHELKTASDGDALEINAKESELDFTGGKPEDYEEGEIVDKLKNKKPLAESNKSQPQEKEPEMVEDKEESNKEAEQAAASFKKLSKNNKERNYRDKDKENDRSRSKEKKSEKENKKERRKEKRKELERYNVRSMIAEKPRRVRDKFGRDETRRRSPSRSSRSATPPVRRSFSRGRSASRERAAKKRHARTKSRSRTPVEKRRSRSPRTRRPRSASRERERVRSKWRRSRERYNSKSRQSASPRRRREWVRRSSKGWSRSLSRSYTPEQRLTPSWTPPRLLESQPVKPQNLTVILNNDHSKKKKEKRKRDKRKELEKAKKRKRNRTPPPSKEVFASGNNILVSVSFNKDKNQRDVINKRKRDMLEDALAKKRKAKDKRKTDSKRKKKRKDLAGVKPVAIIDLERSPFREVTPSPEDVIVLTDSENAESNDMLGLQKAICDSSQQVASPERPMNANYLTGPKTPPEPQVKFTLNAKQTQIRAISNPLHEPDDIEGEIDPQEELEQRLNESLHKGPNTPPEPPNSPPSSPDAYDPFEPTKSRSPTPEPLPPVVQLSSTSQNDSVREESLIDSRNDDDETIDQSHTPPVTDIQPADSQCSNMKPTSPTEKSPEQLIGVVINRVVQSQASIFPSVVSKTIPSFANASLVTSTPLIPARINILNSTVLTPTTIASALPQRIVLPNITKSSPVKVSPNKIPIKSTPIKPMPVKNLMNKSNKSARKSANHNANENSDALLDFESPYSPGSSDYEDLFEPPPPNDVGGTKNTSGKQPAQKGKDQSTFDVLFGSSPVNTSFKNKSKAKGGNSKYKKNSKGTKQVGVKVDEDTLKIMDELPNSAVEMQVKNKLVDDWVLSLEPSRTCSKDKLQYLKKLNRQERVVEEVKLVLKPHYNKKHVNKEEYKDILRRAVPKICHNKSGEINPQKIQNLIEAYVKKVRHSKKVTSSSSVNPQKA